MAGVKKKNAIARRPSRAAFEHEFNDAHKSLDMNAQHTLFTLAEIEWAWAIHLAEHGFPLDLSKMLREKSGEKISPVVVHWLADVIDGKVKIATAAGNTSGTPRLTFREIESIRVQYFSLPGRRRKAEQVDLDEIFCGKLPQNEIDGIKSKLADYQAAYAKDRRSRKAFVLELTEKYSVSESTINDMIQAKKTYSEK